MINYNEINDFIIKVFNYYNGKINIINKAVIDVNMADLITNNAGGHSMMPNIIIIYPKVIARFYEYDIRSIKICIIETIVHELYHTDQLINYRLYMADINYNKYIEHSCQLQTAIYIAGHTQEIQNVFGVNVFLSKDKYNDIINYWWYPGVSYQRRYLYDHVFMFIDNLCGIDETFGNLTYESIKYAVINNKNINIKINEDYVELLGNEVYMNMDKFNKFAIKYHCNVSYPDKFNIDIDTYGDINIVIELEAMNFMCKMI